VNEADKIRQVMRIREQVVPADRRWMNCVRFSAANSKEHEIKKAEICFELTKNNNYFITEARFINGGRCDILSLTEENGICYEIVHSESEKSILKKQSRYPFPLVIIKA